LVRDRPRLRVSGVTSEKYKKARAARVGLPARPRGFFGPHMQAPDFGLSQKTWRFSLRLYNEAVAQANTTFICLDRTDISLAGQSAVEPGDLLAVKDGHAQRTEMPEIAGHRLGTVSLTRGNVDDFWPWGKYTPETELSGWGTWIRTRINGVRV